MDLVNFCIGSECMSEPTSSPHQNTPSACIDLLGGATNIPKMPSNYWPLYTRCGFTPP